MVLQDIEEGFVRAFILPKQRQRLLWLMARPKRRQQLRQSLAHFKHLDSRYAHRIPSDAQTHDGVIHLLRQHGVGAMWPSYLISEKSDLDGQLMPVEEALEAVMGKGMATIVSFITGQVAYFEDEEPGERYLLLRGAA